MPLFLSTLQVWAQCAEGAGRTKRDHSPCMALWAQVVGNHSDGVQVFVLEEYYKLGDVFSWVPFLRLARGGTTQKS